MSSGTNVLSQSQQWALAKKKIATLSPPNERVQIDLQQRADSLNRVVRAIDAFTELSDQNLAVVSELNKEVSEIVPSNELENVNLLIVRLIKKFEAAWNSAKGANGLVIVRNIATELINAIKSDPASLKQVSADDRTSLRQISEAVKILKPPVADANVLVSLPPVSVGEKVPTAPQISPAVKEEKEKKEVKPVSEEEARKVLEGMYPLMVPPGSIPSERLPPKFTDVNDIQRAYAESRIAQLIAPPLPVAGSKRGLNKMEADKKYPSQGHGKFYNFSFVYNLHQITFTNTAKYGSIDLGEAGIYSKVFKILSLKQNYVDAYVDDLKTHGYDGILKQIQFTIEAAYHYFSPNTLDARTLKPTKDKLEAAVGKYSIPPTVRGRGLIPAGREASFKGGKVSHVSRRENDKDVAIQKVMRDIRIVYGEIKAGNTSRLLRKQYHALLGKLESLGAISEDERRDLGL